MIDRNFSHVEHHRHRLDDRPKAGAGRAGVLRLAMTACAMAALLATGPARADDLDDEPVRDRGIIGNIMNGLGARDGSEDIRYRERSPLVIPPKLDLPQPEARRPEGANWPKDPDVIERRAAQKAARERNKERENDPYYAMDPRNIEPVGVARARQATASAQPGSRDELGRNIGEGSGLLSPSQLQSKMDIFNIFGGKKDDQKQETFNGEPVRETLTQPPPGYQTPAKSGQGYAASAESGPRQQRMEETGGIMAPGTF